jgi:multidrug efflux pump subunit AcrA (membrane-fusion protein)
VGLSGVGGVVVYSNPGMSKPIRGFFSSGSNDVITYTVRPTSLAQTVVERGSLESQKNEDVYCLVEGQTTIISIKPEGSRVSKGELVCELDSASLRDQLVNQQITTKSASANFENAKLTREVAEIAVVEYEEGIYVQDLQTVEGEIKLAESDLSRSEDRVDWARRMYDKGYVSMAQKVSEELALKKARFTLEQSQSKRKVLVDYTRAKTIKELKSEVEKARSDELAKKATYELEVSKEKKLEKQIASCRLTAPNDGLVVYANDPNRAFGSNQPQIEEGATVRERQKIFSLPDINKMQVNTKVHESQIDKIGPNMKAKILVEAFADQKLNGTVVDVQPLPDPTSFFSSDIKVYTTHVKIDDSLQGLRPGMNAQVEILVDRRDNVLAVPINAILQYDGKDHVTKRADDRFVRTVVELGPSNERFVQVNKGIKDGDVVVLNPKSLMTEDEVRETFGSGSKAAKKDWGEGGPTEAGSGEAGTKGEGGPKAAVVPGAAEKKGAAPAGKPGEAGKGKAKAKGKGGRGNRPPFMAKIPQTEMRKLFTASEEEKMEILKKAGLTAEEIQQFQQFAEQMKARFQGGGGFGGGRPGGGGGPPGGGQGGP